MTKEKRIPTWVENRAWLAENKPGWAAISEIQPELCGFDERNKLKYYTVRGYVVDDQGMIRSSAYRIKYEDFPGDETAMSHADTYAKSKAITLIRGDIDTSYTQEEWSDMVSAKMIALRNVLATEGSAAATRFVAKEDDDELRKMLGDRLDRLQSSSVMKAAIEADKDDTLKSPYSI